MGELPRMVRVRQIWQRPRVQDIPATVAAQLERLELGAKIRPGQSVAITAGSRGIAKIAVILRAVVAHLRQLGTEPFLVPAMGSHGGGTAAGQQRLDRVLRHHRSLLRLPDPRRHGDRRRRTGGARFSDSFRPPRASGRSCVRLRTHQAAHDARRQVSKRPAENAADRSRQAERRQIYHRAMLDYGFDTFAPDVARRVVRECRVVAGLAVLENAYDEVAQLVALRPEEFEAREPELLRQAVAWMPRLPFDKVDVLLVDEIGKNISGAGLDTNVVGRKFNDHAAAPDEVPKVRRIIIRGMSSATHGNAIGLGMTEFCKTSLIEQMDRQATWLNGLIAGHVSAAMQPLHFPTDRELLDAALSTLGLVEPPNARVMWIKNTLDLGELACSTAYLKETDGRADLKILTEPAEFPLDTAGNLPASGVYGAFG